MGWRGRLYPPRSLRSLQRPSQRRASEKTRDPRAEEGRKDRAAGGGASLLLPKAFWPGEQNGIMISKASSVIWTLEMDAPRRDRHREAMPDRSFAARKNMLRWDEYETMESDGSGGLDPIYIDRLVCGNIRKSGRTG